MCEACSSSPWMFQRPSGLCTRLTLGSVKDILENSTRRRHSELRRRVMRTSSARSDGLGAEGGVLVDHEVFQREAGQRQQVQRELGRSVPAVPVRPRYCASTRRWKRLTLISGGMNASRSTTSTTISANPRRRRRRPGRPASISCSSSWMSVGMGMTGSRRHCDAGLHTSARTSPGMLARRTMRHTAFRCRSPHTAAFTALRGRCGSSGSGRRYGSGCGP